MSGRVAVCLPAGRGGRRRGLAVGVPVAPGGSGATASPAPERVPRVARVLALAHHWQGLIRLGAVRDQAELARLVGVSRARVTQVMDLLHLAPDLQDEILVMSDRLARPLHRKLLPVAAQALWANQRRLWPSRSAEYAPRASASRPGRSGHDPPPLT